MTSMNSIILIAVFVAVVVVSMSEGANMRGSYRRPRPQVRKQQEDYYYIQRDTFCSCELLDTVNIQVSSLDTRVEQLEQTSSSSSGNRLARSCEELKTQQPDSPSGYYDLLIGGIRQNVFCNFEELCGDNGGWLRVGHLDMTRGGENCPSNLQLSNIDGIRSCGRSDNLCESQFLDTLNSSYTKVCGRVTGFQKGSPNAFEIIGATGQRGNIDTAYVDGVSITKGSPREHIWSYAVPAFENEKHCPCDVDSAASSPVPDFVGEDYFCETAPETTFSFTTVYTDDLLWDGEQCGPIQEVCCEASRNMPWFEKVLDTPSTDFLELRVCCDQGIPDEDVHVNFYEIYIKM